MNAREDRFGEEYTADLSATAAGEGEKKKIGRPRKIKSARQMEQAWEDYKACCDHRMIVTHEFSQKEAIFVSARLLRRTTYTIEGFCVFLKIARSKFYENYADDPAFGDVVTRIREECEVDTRLKLETGEIPTQLSGLLLSKYGYTTKVDTGAEARAAALEEARKLLSGVPSVIGMERATDTSSGASPSHTP